jgi:hypothetical protein
MSDDVNRRQIERQKALEQRLAALERLETPGGQVDAWARAVGMLQMFPGVRGIWPMSAQNSSGQVIDVSGNGNHLTQSGSPLIVAATTSLFPYVSYATTGRYHFHTDSAEFDILGNEPYVFSGIRGLTMGCWVRRQNVSAAQEGFLSKRSTGNSGYALYGITTGAVRGIIGSGAVEGIVTSAAVAANNEWRFCALKFVPATSVSVWLDSEKTTVATAIATIDNNAANFQIGNLAGLYLNGFISLAFLCAAAAPDLFINSFYGYSRGLYGV